MAISSEAFYDLVETLQDLSDKQTFAVMLNLRELASGGINPVKEACASFNALNELEVMQFLNQAKQQFTKDDWNTLTDN